MASSKKSIKNVTVVDTGALDCGVCESPLKPPIFQCEVGHMVCSECSEKMAAAEACHVCRRALAGGYKRCYGAEHILECLKVVCPNKAHGCSVMLALDDDDTAHLKVCQYRPFHCPAEDCTFTARQVMALRSHFCNTHHWPETIRSWDWPANLELDDGFCHLGMYYKTSGLILVKVTPESYGRAVTVIYMLGRKSKTYRFQFEYEGPCGTHRQEYEVKQAASTDLVDSDGLSFLDGRFDFVVPVSAQPLDPQKIKLAFKCLLA